VKALIVYASLTGNKQEMAMMLAEILEYSQVEVRVSEVQQVSPYDYHAYDLCLMGSYTYEMFGKSGVLPQETHGFYEELRKEDLSGHVWGTFGSGDLKYSAFCQAVDDFSYQFEKTGATQGAVPIKINGPAEEDYERYILFANQLIETAVTLKGRL